jgi:hypothetical protein
MGRVKELCYDCAELLKPIHARRPRPSFEQAVREAFRTFTFTSGRGGGKWSLSEGSLADARGLVEQSIELWIEQLELEGHNWGDSWGINAVWRVSWRCDREVLKSELRRQRRQPQAWQSGPFVKPGSLYSRAEVEQELTRRGIRGWERNKVSVAELRLKLPLDEEGYLEGGRQSDVPVNKPCCCGPQEGHMTPDAEGLCPRCQRTVPVFTCPKCLAGTLKRVTAVPHWSTSAQTFYGCSRYPACKHTDSLKYRPTRKQVEKAAETAAEVAAATMDALAMTPAGDDLFADTYADDLIGAVAAAEMAAAEEAAARTAAELPPVALAGGPVVGNDTAVELLESSDERHGSGAESQACGLEADSEVSFAVVQAGRSTPPAPRNHPPLVELPINASLHRSSRRGHVKPLEPSNSGRKRKRQEGPPAENVGLALERYHKEVKAELSDEQSPSLPTAGDRVLVEFSDGQYEGTVISLRNKGKTRPKSGQGATAQTKGGVKQEFEVIFEDRERWWISLDGLWTKAIDAPEEDVAEAAPPPREAETTMISRDNEQPASAGPCKTRGRSPQPKLTGTPAAPAFEPAAVATAPR